MKTLAAVTAVQQPEDYSLRPNLRQLLAQTKVFLGSLEALERLPLTPYHGDVLAGVCQGVERVTEGVAAIVEQVEGPSRPNATAELPQRHPALTADLTEVLSVVQAVEDKVRRFALLLGPEGQGHARSA